MPPLAHLAWPFFDDTHRQFAPGARRLGGPRGRAAHRPRRCGPFLPRAGARLGRGGLAQGRRAGGLWRPSRKARRADALRRAGDPGLARQPGRFRLRHAGPRHAARSRCSAATHRRPNICRRCATGAHIAAFALSEPEAGSDVGALATTAPRTAGACTYSTASRPGSPTAASPITTSCSRAPARRRGAKGFRAFVVDADTPGLAVAGRIEVIAPHPLATLRFTDCRVPLRNRLGAAGRRIQGGHGDARHLPLDGRRRGARLGAPRLRRGDRARAPRASCSARRSPICSSPRPRSPTAPSTSTPRRCWSIAPPGQGSRRGAHHARGLDGEAVRHRDGADA